MRSHSEMQTGTYSAALRLPWLCFRLEGCDDTLSVHFGVLGLLRHAGKVHRRLRPSCIRPRAISTRCILHPGCNELRSGVGPSGVVVVLLVQHIVGHAGHMIYPDLEGAALAYKLPDLRAVIRDRAHILRHLNEH